MVDGSEEKNDATILEERSVGEVCRLLEGRGVKLFDHQREGVEWMMHRERSEVVGVRGGFLCDDPGLGKTFQTIATMVGNRVDHTLVIVPKCVLKQWGMAFKKLMPGTDVYIHHGTGVPSRKDGGLEEFERRREAVTLTTLGMVLGRPKKKKQREIETTILHDVHWGRIIIDESQEIRNRKSKRNRAVTALSGDLRWCLSGTPVQNKATDMLAQYRFLGIEDMAESTLDKANKYFLKRRTKFEVAGRDTNFDIPELEQTIHSLEFATEEERSTYNLIRTNVAEEYEKLVGSSAPEQDKQLQMLELLLRLRQSSTNIQLAMNGLAKKFNVELGRYRGGSTKMSFLVEELGKLEGKENSLVFCQWSEEIKMLGDMLDEKGIMWDKYDGSMSTDQRERVMGRFTDLENDGRSLAMRVLEEKAPNVLLIQIKAGGVGLNLQQFTQIFLTTADWNPSNEIQAIARAHRMGQGKGVRVHRLSLHDNKGEFDTIDERLFNIQSAKRRLMADILHEDSALDMGRVDTSMITDTSVAMKLTDEDARYLLG